MEQLRQSRRKACWLAYPANEVICVNVQVAST